MAEKGLEKGFYTLGEKLKEALEKKLKIEIPESPKEHLEKESEYQKEIQKETEAVEKGEKIEKTKEEPPLKVRWQAMHEEFLKEEKKKQQALEILETISCLEDEVLSAKEFLKELVDKGKYHPESPAVKEARELILENEKIIDELFEINAFVKELWFLKKEFPKRINQILEEGKERLLDFGDLIPALKQAEKRNW